LGIARFLGADALGIRRSVEARVQLSIAGGDR
jgi:hypothetical protein